MIGQNGRRMIFFPDQRKRGQKVVDLTPYDWWMLVGTYEAERVAIEAGTTYAHFKHLAHGRRNASLDLAKRLSAASAGGMGVTQILGIAPSKGAKKDKEVA